MGNQIDKIIGVKSNTNQPMKLTKKDFKFLMNQTGYTKFQISALFNQYITEHPNGTLEKKDYIKLYNTLKNQPNEIVESIAVQAFKAFDPTNKGTITFREFLVNFF